MLGRSICAALLLFLLCATFLPLVNAWATSSQTVVDYLFDDSYYYLGIANNIIRGHGSTFGGVVATNGYQPAWLVLISGLLFLTTTSVMGSITALAVFNGLISVLGAGRLLFIGKWPNELRLALTISTTITVLLFPWVFAGGMETVLFLLFIPFFVDMERPRRHGLWLGLGFFALFLVRLDATSLFLAWLAVPNRRDVDGTVAHDVVRKATSVSALVFIGLAAGYVLINYLTFGLPVPVSGVSKALGNRAGENVPLVAFYVVYSLTGVLLLIVCRALSLMTGRNARYRFDYQVRLFGLATIICAGYYGILSGWRVWGWYYWPVAFLTLFSLARLMHALAEFNVVALLRDRRTRFRLLSAGALLLIVGGFISRPLVAVVRNTVSLKNPAPWAQGSSFNVVSLRTIDEFFATATPGVVGMGDRAGGLGYFLPEDFRFIHLEGLVADREFYTARKEDRAVEYLRSKHLKYLVVDREEFFETRDRGELIYGIAEPIQASSIHEGAFLICQPEKSILFDSRRVGGRRMMFDFEQSVQCPEGIGAQFRDKTRQYEMLRYFSIPSEYQKNPAYQIKLVWSRLLSEIG